MIFWIAVALIVVAIAVDIRLRSDRRTLAARKVEAEQEAQLSELCAEAAPSLREATTWRDHVHSEIDRARRAGQWISRDQRLEWEAVRPTATQALKALSQHADAGAEARTLLGFLNRDLTSLSEDANAKILDAELDSRRTFLDSIESQPLTDKQAEAVVTFDNRVQVVAAAGSGKTSVMVARAAYAVMRGFVPADKILLLDFNKDAATELEERVVKRFKAASIDATGLKAATFHSFGLSVIGRATGRKPRLAGWLDGGGDVEMISRIVDELRDRSPSFRFKWDIYRLLFAGMSDQPEGGVADSYDFATRETGFRTFRGETVKSQGERMIADFLFINGVDYEYERPYAHDVADRDHSQYRPDFYYPAVDVWHEHWALGADGKPPKSFTGYADSMRWKKSLHQRYGTTLVETTWATIIDQSGFQPLAADLKSAGLTLDWNPDRPIPGARPVRHEDLARLMRSFLSHVKSNSLSKADLAAKLKQTGPRLQRYRAQVFLDLFWEVYGEWERRLAADDSIDFEDMLVQAAGAVESGAVDMACQMVCVSGWSRDRDHDVCCDQWEWREEGLQEGRCSTAC